MSAHGKPYVREVSRYGWFFRSPRYLRYMAREVTCVFIGLHALILIVALMRLSEGREAWDVHGAFLQRFRPVLGAAVAQRFDWSSKVSDAQVAKARAFREQWRQHMQQILGADGVLLMPTMPDVAPWIRQTDAELEDYRNRATSLLCVAGMAGLPQVSLPLASHQGAPLGISLLGPEGSDRSLVKLAEHIHRMGS
jgi:amidase